MNQSKNILLLLLLICCFVNLTAQVPLTKKVKASIDLELTKNIKKLKVVGASFAVIDHGEIVYSEGFGFSDLVNQVKVTSNTIFPIGSCTKTFTAIAVMQLHEKGLLDINESIKKYIPELTIPSKYNDGNEIFIKDILSHISGLPSDIMNGVMTDKPISIDWSIRELNKQTTISPNQFIYSYSNIGYALLGELIERVSGVSYSEYLKQAIFEPLKMDNTTAGNSNKLSKGYLKKKVVPYSQVRDVAAGWITSTTADMSNLVKMMMNDGVFEETRLLSEKSIADMEQNHLMGTTMNASSTYGKGLGVYTAELKNGATIQNKLAYGHGGFSPPFHADFRYIPELEVGVIVFSNTRHSGLLRSAGYILGLYLKEAKGIDYQLIRKESSIENNCEEVDIPGLYNLGMGSIEVTNLDKIKFKVEGNKVVLKRIENSFDYSVTAKLFGILPIKMKDVVFRFVKKKNQMYITQLDLEGKVEEFIGAKTEKVPISNAWAATIGSYKIVKSFPSSFDEFDFSRATIKIQQENDVPYLSIKTPNRNFQFFLNIKSDSIAYTGGMGRHMNYMVKILENKNVYFSGFEFEKL